MFQKYLNKEVKIGLLVVVCGFVLFFGLNYLKGINIFNPMNCYFAKYENLEGLTVSSPVYIKGYKVGQVNEIRYDFTKDVPFIVTLDIDMDVDLPEGTIAELHEDGLLGGKCITLLIDTKQTKFLPSGDTLKVNFRPSITDLLSDSLFVRVENAVIATDSLMNSLRRISDSEDLKSSLKSIKTMSANLASSSDDLKNILRKDVPPMVKNINHAAENLAKVGEKVNSLDLETTVDSLNKTIGGFHTVLYKINNSEGSLGLLLNDKTLYNNFTNTGRDADELVKDIKENPKKYINITIFGKKEKK